MSDDLSVTQDTDVAIAPVSTEIVVVADYEVEVIQTFEQGPPGPQGPQGPLGPIGPAGPEGPSGNTILYGARDPLPGDGLPGDSWINTATNMLFGPKSLAGTWPAGVSLIGPQGPQGIQGIIGPQGPQGIQGIQGIPGNTVLYGSVNPVAGTGVDGNFYINTTTHFMFGPKALGAWPAGTSLVGPQGAQGIQGPPGAVAEAPTDGQTYGRRGSDGSWQLITITGTVRYDTVQALTLPQQQQARQNIYAAPFDAMAERGLQINGAMEISQENGTSNVVLTNANKYLCDLWLGTCSHPTGTLTCNQINAGGVLPGLFYYLKMNATAAMAAYAAADNTLLSHYIEGNRWQRLRWGTANMQPVTLGFWVYANATGIASVSIRNFPAARSYVADFTVNAASTWEYKTVTIPGCPDGAWLTDHQLGASIHFCFGAGSGSRLAPNVWTNSGFFISNNTTNFFGTVNFAVMIGGIIILPGTEMPTAAQLPYIMRPAQSEMPLVQRYYRNLQWSIEGYSAAGNQRCTCSHSIPAMRQGPSITRVSITSSSNIRANDTNTYVTCSSTNESSVNTSIESAAAGYTFASGVLEKLSTRF